MSRRVRNFSSRTSVSSRSPRIKRRQAGVGFVQQRLFAQEVVLSAVVNGLEKVLIEQCAGQHFGVGVIGDVVLEKQTKNILQQRAEVGQQSAAFVFQLAQRRRLGAQMAPDAPVVGVVFDPKSILGKRLKNPFERRF